MCFVGCSYHHKKMNLTNPEKYVVLRGYHEACLVSLWALWVEQEALGSALLGIPTSQGTPHPSSLLMRLAGRSNGSSPGSLAPTWETQIEPGLAPGVAFGGPPADASPYPRLPHCSALQVSN